MTGLSCAVIGGGVMGAAAAYALARRGARVTLFEQFAFGHHHGSSHGATRLFRTAYFEHPDYVPLLRRAAEGWRALERGSGETLFIPCGVLMAGNAASGLMAGTRNAAEIHGLRLDDLTAAETAARFPWLSLGPGMEAMIEPDAGFVYADRARMAFLKGAETAGAKIHYETPVRGVHVSGARVELITAHGKLFFDRVVAAPGAYASEILGHIGARVSPLRKALFWTSPGDERATLAGGFLPFAVEEDDGRFFYGFPAVDADGVKIGEHTGGAPLADARDSADDYAAQSRRDLEAFLRRRAPSLSPVITKEQSCLYEISPDRHFIIDRHPEDGRIAFAIGHSGHGFKFAPVVGEALADLVTAGETAPEFDFLSLARFDAD